jgi:catechol 2,3-dioxygenase-like lactoylglutathione lyase family enzyme
LIVERTDFVSVPVRDKERAAQFYGETLGLTRLPGPDGGFPEFQLGENVSVYLLDMTQVGSEFSAPHTAHLALRVPDVAAARAELEAKGVDFEGETLDTSVCHMAFFKDPDGNQFMLHRRYAPRES